MNNSMQEITFKFFEQALSTVLDPEEEREMYEQFSSVIAITRKVDDMIKEIDYLEKQPWNKPA